MTTAPLIPEDIARLRQIAMEATPGPWHNGHYADDTHSCNCRSILSEYYCGAICMMVIGNGLPIGDGGNDAPHPEEAKANEEICQILGKALGFPWFKDDQKNFPGASEADGVCVGDNVAESMADMAAEEIKRLRADHADIARRNAVPRQRPDLPVDRLPAIAEYEAEIERLRALVGEMK